MSERTLHDRLSHFALQSVGTPLGRVQFRQAGSVNTVRTCVLLHGIGSGSASWLAQLEAAERDPQATRVLAWEAPGYGASHAVPAAQPWATDYAHRVWAWLDALQVSSAVTLVGHSLGAIVAASAAVLQHKRVQQLVLLAPAQGYGAASEAVRQQKRDDRLHTLNTLGPAGMAQKRASAMLSPQASSQHMAFVQSIMSQVHVAGYTQATHLLAQSDLLTDLQQWSGPLVVASGQADTITPASGCQTVAQARQVPWHDLGNAGHACALEAADAVNALLQLPTTQTMSMQKAHA
jgi:pimeloyl-ACP methyl ester carboxylesterase